MTHISTTMRMSLGLVLLTATVLLTADLMGFIPDRTQAIVNARWSLCESLAQQCSEAIQRDDMPTAHSMMSALVDRDTQMLSAAVRTAAGELLVQAGDHQRDWVTPEGGLSTPTHARVPIFKGRERWGTVEVAFRETDQVKWLGMPVPPVAQLAAFVAGASFFLYILFLRKTLRHLDPSSVVPDRVKTALDAFSEGVLFLDANEEIVLANSTFARTIGRPLPALLGRKASELGFGMPKSDSPATDLPWTQALSSGETRLDSRLTLKTPSSGTSTFVVNATPILGHDGHRRGALVTFDDVTELEQKNQELEEALRMLQASQDEVRRKNQKLQILAIQDPLTGCLSRRSFFKQLEAEYSAAGRYGHPLACVMLDIDYFKAVNDQHGHAVGDDVLRSVSEILRGKLRKSDIVCRYGGEEFCILLPHTDAESAAEAMEGIRQTIESDGHPDVPVTASFGVSSTEHAGANAREFLGLADKALYAAKNGGRNRVIRWRQIEHGQVA